MCSSVKLWIWEYDGGVDKACKLIWIQGEINQTEKTLQVGKFFLQAETELGEKPINISLWEEPWIIQV